MSKSVRNCREMSKSIRNCREKLKNVNKCREMSKLSKDFNFLQDKDYKYSQDFILKSVLIFMIL